MKIKLLYMIACLGIHLSIQPAAVTILNNTDEPVLAQINNQRRAKTFYKPITWRRDLYGAGSVVTMGIPPAIVEPVAAIRQAVGVPNFVTIKPNASVMFATTVFKGGVPGGAYSQTAFKKKGRPITKITFARVKGFKTIKGTLNELKKSLESLANTYGGIALSVRKHLYQNQLSGAKDRKLYGRHRYAIRVPIMEQFTYELGENKIKRSEQDAIIELQTWGDARRVK